MSDNVTAIHEDRFPDSRHWFTSSELINRAGISYRQLDYWVRTGLLTVIDDTPTPLRSLVNPERVTAATPGSGYSRYYDLAQVTRARAIRQLLEAGVSLQIIRERIDEFLDTGNFTIGPITITRNQHDQPQEAPAR